MQVLISLILNKALWPLKLGIRQGIFAQARRIIHRGGRKKGEKQNQVTDSPLKISFTHREPLIFAGSR